MRLTMFGVAAAACVAIHAQVTQGRGVVRNVTGTASFAEPRADWRPLATGRILSPGTAVRTGVGSTVDIDLAVNGPDLRLTENTALLLDHLEIDRTGVDSIINTQLDLRSGTIQGRVRRLPAGSQYEVKTPNTVVGIRPAETETTYQISANGVTSILEGGAVVVYINPSTGAMSTHQVFSGQTFTPPTDPGMAGAVPTVEATPPGTLLPALTPGVPTEQIVSVPVIEPFVSPETGLRR